MEGSEVALTSAVLAALGAAVYFVWSGSTTPPNSASATPYTTQREKRAKPTGRAKGKKRKTANLPSFVPVTDSASEIPDSVTKQVPKAVLSRSEATIPGGFGPVLSASEIESAVSTKSKKKKKAKKPSTPATGGGTPTGSTLLATPVSSSTHLQESNNASEFDSETGWTKVTNKGSKARAVGAGATTAESASDAGITTSVTEEEGSVADKKEESLTFAEKMLPKPAKTVVDDMVDGPKDTIVRTLRVVGSSSGNVPDFPRIDEDATVGDDEDVKGSGAEADADDWNIISHSKKRGSRTPSTYASDTTPSARTISSTTTASTKRQRQNQAQYEANKAVKEQAEKDRLQRLEKYQREREKARIEEQFSSSKSKSGGAKVTSGGMRAVVDEKGNMVWE